MSAPKTITAAALIFTFAALASHGRAESRPSVCRSATHARALARAKAATMPLVFEQNVGQAPESSAFLARGSRFTLGIEASQTVLTPKHGGAPVRTRLVGANPNASVRGESRLKAKIDYFRGNDPAKWQADVPAFARVKTAAVYPGIDLIHYGRPAGELEYDFVVAPGADPRTIRFRVEGIERAETAANGDLLLHTSEGVLAQRRPVCYQEIDGVRREVRGAYRLCANAVAAAPEVEFLLGDYDRTRTLTIDPVLTYGTYLGGSGFDSGQAIAVGANGNVYVTGSTASPNFPLKGEFQSGSASGDVFLSVIDPKLSGAAALVYSTCLGGSAGEQGRAIAVDGSGKAYLTGGTGSSNFPLVRGFMGRQASEDVFVAVIDPSQTGVNSLTYSSYLGGNFSDSGIGIATDGTRAFVTGTTDSTNFPATSGAFQTNLGGYDAFLTILDTTATGAASLIYSTYVGGNSYDIGMGIELVAGGRLMLAGTTESSDLPTTASKVQGFGGGQDFFVALLDPTRGPNALVYGTYLGGTGMDRCQELAVDSSGRAYLTGWTESTNYPTTANKFKGDQDGPEFDAVFSLIDPSRSGAAALIYSSYFGGGGSDLAFGVDVDSGQRAWISGHTSSNDFPTTSNRFHAFAGETDAFVAQIDATKSGANSLVFSTFLGGSDIDTGNAVAVTSGTLAYVTGETGSANFPTTADRFQADQPDRDAYLVEIDFAAANQKPDADAGADQTTQVPNDGDPNTKTAPVTLDGSGSSDVDGDPLTFEWRNGSQVLTGTTAQGRNTQDLIAGTYTFTLKVTDARGLSDEDTVKIVVKPETQGNPGPDLQGEWKDPLEIEFKERGSGIRVTVKSLTLRNDGTKNAKKSKTVFYLSTDALFDAADVKVGTKAAPALKAGKSKTVDLVFNLPPGIDPGKASGMFVIAVLDGTRKVTETDEANNTVAAKIP